MSLMGEAQFQVDGDIEFNLPIYAEWLNAGENSDFAVPSAPDY